MSAAIIVSPLERIGEMAARHGCRQMISLMAENHDFARPGMIDRHLVLRMNDIAFAGAGDLVAPGRDHVDQIIDFSRRWAADGPLLVHCWMGVSRSPAAAMIAALAVAPEIDDGRLAEALRAASPSATPNRRLVALGDAALARGGRFAAAVRTIGRGRDCRLNAPFRLDLDGLAMAPLRDR
ncbi:tyrosine phosphatase family protein [Martelella soudanensis]|uniref:tyrosine phosphatase family protein n=1 Tax=unclassified Martelella TaxID=2629616 RepID=UPI0015DE61A8|nr:MULTISPECIES: protein tyrosine phosphatase [unclassified Martelella]